MRLTILFTFIGTLAIAQVQIRGVVTDTKGEPIPGANVVLRGTYDGASTNAAGEFNFLTHEKGSHFLDVTSVGYKAIEKTIELSSNELSITVSLQEEINELDAVVISAGAFTAGEERRRTILKPLDIATTAGATADIAGALNTLPGTQKVGESGRLFVRGGDGSETRTFIDGMVVLNAYGPAAPNTPSRGRFLPFMFKGTSFSTGGYSAEYGQALSSALVLNSKDKAELNQTDIGLLSVGGDVAHTQVWSRGSASGKIQYTNLSPYTEVIRQRVDWKDPMKAIEGSAAFRQEIGQGMIKVFGSFSNTDFSLYSHDIVDPNIKTPFEMSNTYRYVNTAYQTTAGTRSNLKAGLSYSYNRNGLRIDGKPASETESGIHAKVSGDRSISEKVEWRLGAEIFDRQYEAERYNDTLQLTQTRSFREVITAGFTEAEWRMNNHFVTKAGARFEQNSLNQQVSVDPRLSLAYKPGKRGQFGLATGIFRQSAQNQYLRNNTQLASERAGHFILNYQILTDRQTFRIEAFYKKYFDLVRFVNGDPMQINNSGSGYSQGIEFFWRDNQTLRNVDYWVSYSWLDTKREYLNYPGMHTPSFASAHNFSFVYKHFVTELKTQFGVTYSFTSGRPYYNPNLGSDRFLSERTPDYHDLSVNISYLPKSWLIIYASCTNLLGRDNIFGYQYSATPDSQGHYASRAIRQPADHFMFLGVLMTFSKNKTVNQLPNL